MHCWADILAAGGDDGSNQLIYVIAVLILSALGALAERFKQKKADAEQKKVSSRPAQEGPVSRSGDVESPARPVPRPTPPRPPMARPQRPAEEWEIHIPPQPRPMGHPAGPQPTTARLRGPKRHPRRPEVVAEVRIPIRTTPPTADLANRWPVENAPVTAPAASNLSPGAVSVSRPAKPTTGGLHIRLVPSNLREAVILSELLQPPVAMRDPFEQR